MSNALIKPEPSRTIAEMQSLGEVFVRSKFFADSTDAAQAIVKVMAGAELGFPPIASMTGVYIVKGKVSLSANLIAAAIKRSGRYTYRVRKLDDSGCVLEFFENGESIGESSFAREDAQRAQLLGKETWRSFFRNMAFARALSNGAKWHCPDVFGGPVYTPEELGANIDGEGEIVEVAPSREEKPVKSLALVPPAQPEKAPEQFDLDHEQVDVWIYAAYQAAGRPQAFNDWKNENSYRGKPLQWKQEQLDILNEETRQKVKAKAAISNPLPETQNTPRDDEAHADLDREIKQCILDAGGNAESWENYRVEKKIDEQTLGWKQSLIEKMREKLSKAQPKSEPEPATGYDAQREDGKRKVLRAAKGGKVEAVWEKPKDMSKVKAVMDEVIAEHWPNTPEGYNQGYRAARAFIVETIGEFKNFSEIKSKDQEKAIKALAHWEPVVVSMQEVK